MGIDFGINLTNEQEQILRQIGFPTFDEYCKNPGQWKVNKEIYLDAFQGAPTRFNTKDITFVIAGYKVKSMDKVAEIAKDLNWDTSLLEFKPELDKSTGGAFDIVYEVTEKSWLRRDKQGEEDQGRQEEGTEALA